MSREKIHKKINTKVRRLSIEIGCLTRVNEIKIKNTDNNSTKDVGLAKKSKEKLPLSRKLYLFNMKSLLVERKRIMNSEQSIRDWKVNEL
jgi:ribosomal protein L4